MFEKIINFFKNLKKDESNKGKSKDAAKERLHLVLMQDRANVSADFLELMKQEIIDVIKKYIEVDENAIDVRLTNKTNDDGTNGAPALYANIPIAGVKYADQKLESGVIASANTHIDNKPNVVETVINKQEEIKVDNSFINENIKQEEIQNLNEEKVQEEIKEAEEIKEKVESETTVVTENNN